MIKINKRRNIPSKLTTDGVTATENLKKEYVSNPVGYTSGDVKMKIDNGIYGPVKGQLKREQYDKCCYCESINRAYGDVEHFRPKGAWKQEKGDSLSEIGYYWLTYEWSNLLFACQVCNTSFKGNFFPLLNPTERALNHLHDIKKEIPLLIHPAFEDPEKYIYYEGIDPHAIDNNIKGRTTIRLLGLRAEAGMSADQIQHAEDLANDRKMYYKIMKQMYIKATKAFPKNLRIEAKEILEEAKGPKGKYSLMIKCAIKDEFKY